MFFVDKWIHSNSLINVQPEENCRIDEKGSNLGKMIGPNFRNWSEFRTIGPNAEQLVRIPNDWSEFRTIGPNSEQLTSLTSVFSKIESVELLCCSDVEDLCAKQFKKCSSVGVQKKKSAWTDLDRVSFKKFFKESMFKSKNWRGLV